MNLNNKKILTVAVVYTLSYFVYRAVHIHPVNELGL